jgi:DNA mismatch repair protein MutL
VRDKVLTHAVLQGYDTLLMKGQYPAVVLLLEVPFADVDVNVHPAKYEVRFRRQADVHEAVATAVRQALQREAKGPLPQFQDFAQAAFTGVRESALPYAIYPAARPDVPMGQVEAFPIPSQAAVLPVGEGFFSSMNVLGQILGCYLVCASSQGLALIDQHAAHERVAFEKLRRDLNNGIAQTQNLLIPQTLEPGAGEVALMEKHLPLLERFGYLIESVGPESYAITAVPAFLPEGDYRHALRRMIAELAEVDDSDKVRQHLEERLATIACHSVIRANRQLEMSEMRALLRALDETQFATQCPHGRPVLMGFSRDELDRMFKRVV